MTYLPALPAEISFNQTELSFIEAASLRQHQENAKEFMNNLELEKLMVALYAQFRPEDEIAYKYGGQQSGEDIKVNGLRISLKGGQWLSRDQKVRFNGSMNSAAKSTEDIVSFLAGDHQDWILSLAHKETVKQVSYQITALHGPSLDSILRGTLDWDTSKEDWYATSGGFRLRVCTKRGNLAWLTVPYRQLGHVIGEFHLGKTDDTFISNNPMVPTSFPSRYDRGSLLK